MPGELLSVAYVRYEAQGNGNNAPFLHHLHIVAWMQAPVWDPGREGGGGGGGGGGRGRVMAG